MAFIVLEGLDGAGKSTQIKMLTEHLQGMGKEVEYLHFPRFDAPVYGDLVARFLRGELGGVDQVNPYLVGLIYAGDRSEAAAMIRGWLAEGKCVLLDRYVYSNVGYQCAKIENDRERDRLRDWILELEYGHHGIPRPDLSIFLDVPFSFTRQKLENQREGDDRDYLQGKADIHEASLSLQERVRRVYLDQQSRDTTFKVVPCAGPEGEMLPPEVIFRALLGELKGVI